LVFGGAQFPLNQVLDQLWPELEQGDLVMDGGDSSFQATAMHSSRLAERGIQFMGLGLAGGESAVRHGAIVLAGGPSEARQRSRPILESLAATVRGEACVAYLDTAAAAHLVKLCHAGVECALLQLLSEIFDLAQRALLLTQKKLRDASLVWHLRLFNGYLSEVSGQAYQAADRKSPRRFLEQRRESVRNDPKGNWITQCAAESAVTIPTIEAAFGAQPESAKERRQAWLAAPFRQPLGRFGDDPESVLNELHCALRAAMLITYAQGLALLRAASRDLGFPFHLHEITRAWRGCTRLRTSLLDAITTAFQATPDLPSLLADADLSEQVMARQENLRHAVWRALQLDVNVPALLASLDYLDASREAWLPVNLV
jgi:6-phosphogluconate dehydrogenase